MRLQRLEITGFKSFSDRSDLAFDRGVTAIVGPNGCGKVPPQRFQWLVDAFPEQTNQKPLMATSDPGKKRR